jgi:hypothetical protein
MARPNALLVRVFGVPALLALLTLFGLLSALLGQGGVWHVLAWIALCIPLAVLAWHLARCAQADANAAASPSRRSVAGDANTAADQMH